ncbi:class I ribonucleotide reductase maintenance protein YfaE [Kingella oralis]|uniref:class I ribonucleotide reductase maintenance protein YfaE n=1 Tax=Kingella oralis TaxID=505 RepID=UPI0034E3FCEF
MFKVTTLDAEFELLPDESLLAGLERTNHAVEYQCRSGYCGSCRVKLLAGRVSYREMPMAFIAQGEILACCCVLESDVVVGCRLRADGTDGKGGDK